MQYCLNDSVEFIYEHKIMYMHYYNYILKKNIKQDGIIY